jgi:hypothetical protein
MLSGGQQHEVRKTFEEAVGLSFSGEDSGLFE